MHIPQAERLRPQTLDDVVGQDKIVELVQKIIQSTRPVSILLWGPPGCGKTTIAKLYANAFSKEFIPLSAVTTSTTDIKKLIAERATPLFQPILFVDEIHRFNKSQQDLFLPYVENGTIILVGATTENPSFSLNNALLSRLRILTLTPLSEEALEKLANRYLQDAPISFEPRAKSTLLSSCMGDGRHLLNNLEMISSLHSGHIDEEVLANLLQKKAPLYDKHDDIHFNLISALHKSVRGSDPDAALYYLARMLSGGEDPYYLLRRLVRMASEDIGLADPQAMQVTLNAWQTFERLGSPEGELAISQATVYLALAPKSNAIYTAFKEAAKLAIASSHISPPKHILNAPTNLMKQEGYGKNYEYDHDSPESFSGQDYFPEELGRQSFYRPIERGFERDMKKRLTYFSTLRSSRQ